MGLVFWWESDILSVLLFSSISRGLDPRKWSRTTQGERLMDRGLLEETFRKRVADLYRSRDGSKSPVEALAVTLSESRPLGLEFRYSDLWERELWDDAKLVVVDQRRLGQSLCLVYANWTRIPSLCCFWFTVCSERNRQFLRFKKKGTFDLVVASSAELLHAVIKIDELLAGLYAKARATEEFMHDLSTGSHDALDKVLQS